MLKSKKQSIAACVSFAAIEFILWILILLGGGKILQFSSVVIAAAVSFIFFKNTPSVIATETALIFTCLADFCLVILEPIRQIPAMLFFSIVQLAYAVRLYYEEENKKRRAYHIYTRIIATFILEALMLMVLGRSADLLTVITMFYFANLAINALFSVISGKNFLFSLGLISFIGCDIFVGLQVLVSDYLSVSADSLIYKIIHPGFNIIWFFYVPSQTLIALSLSDDLNRSKKANPSV